MTPQQRLDASWAAFDLAADTVAATWTPKAPGSVPVPTTIMLDAPGQDVLGGVVSINRVARYRVSQWSSVQQGDTVTIGGVQYRCEAPVPVDDGLVALVDLVKT